MENEYDFTQIENLPEEDVYLICEQMNNYILSQFVVTSTKHRRICQEILDNRRKQYKIIVEDIVLKLNGGFIRVHLLSNLNRLFEISFKSSFHRGNRQLNVFTLQETLLENVSIIKRLTGKVEYTSFEQDFTDSGPNGLLPLKIILMQLLESGYINGRYTTE